MSRVPFLATRYDGANKTLVRPMAGYLGDVAILEFCGPRYSALNDLGTSKHTPELERLYLMFSLISLKIRVASRYG